MGNCCSAEAVVSAAVVPPETGGAHATVAKPAQAAPEGKAAAPAPAVSVEASVPVSLVNTNAFPGEEGRDAQLRACKMIDTPPEPRFDAITKLMASVFKTPVSLLTLIVDDRVWFKSKVGPFGACVCRDGSWCNYILVPSKPEVLITEDASQDARFAGNPYVAGEPHIKFYAGAPLVGTGGVRYGTLCVVDLKPRSFSAEMYALLSNFADLAVQELERDNDALRSIVKQASSFADSHARMSKAVSSNLDGVALFDTRAKPWPVLYANETFAETAGKAVADCTGGGFWDQFEVVQAEGSKDMERQVDSAVAAGRPVRVTVRCKASGQLVPLVLRPAGTDQLAPEKPIGVPNWVRSEIEMSPSLPDPLAPSTTGDVGSVDPELASCFYLAVVEPYSSAPAGAGASSAGEPLSAVLPPGTPRSSRGRDRMSAGSVEAPGTPAAAPEAAGVPHRSMVAYGDRPLPSALVGLEMGPLIGSGSFAKVYRGLWKGGVVAVKVVDCDRPDSVGEDVLAEAVLSQGLVDQHIVRTYAYDVVSRMLVNGGQHERGSVYIVQQHCNRGTLIDAVEKGWFRQRPWGLGSPPDVPAILRTLREVAAGMAYLHSKEIVHRDLTGNNVLLTQSGADPRGFVALVADFGLARVARGGSIAVESYGTVSHMPPEVLSEGKFTPAADVWSWGVLCWEMFYGGRAYAGLRAPNVIYKVISGKETLEVPAAAPPGLQALVRAAWAADPAARPTFEELGAQLEALLSAEGADGAKAVEE